MGSVKISIFERSHTIDFLSRIGKFNIRIFKLKEVKIVFFTIKYIAI